MTFWRIVCVCIVGISVMLSFMNIFKDNVTMATRVGATIGFLLNMVVLLYLGGVLK
jgi:hypothetical protein